MKIQTTALLDKLEINGTSVDVQESTVELEFSAIDTGGGFKDPMLDFSAEISTKIPTVTEKQKISIGLSDPQNEENNIEFSYEGEVTVSDQQINSRLVESQLNKALIGFVLQLLR